jgi:hypothetical protein
MNLVVTGIAFASPCIGVVNAFIRRQGVDRFILKRIEVAVDRPRSLGFIVRDLKQKHTVFSLGF